MDRAQAKLQLIIAVESARGGRLDQHAVLAVTKEYEKYVFEGVEAEKVPVIPENQMLFDNACTIADKADEVPADTPKVERSKSKRK